VMYSVGSTDVMSKLTQTLTQVTMLAIVYLQGCTTNVFQSLIERSNIVI